jgi:small ligand-binding sensory domain FIST
MIDHGAERPGWKQAVTQGTAGAARALATLQSGQTWDEALDAVAATLTLDAAPDLLLVFIDSRFFEHYAAILERLTEATGARHMIGCAGQAIVGTGVESERQPAISVLALSLPGAVLTPVPVDPLPRLERDLEMSSSLDVNGWLIFADPFSVDPMEIVERLEAQWPGRPIVGGLSSSHNRARGTAMFLDGLVFPAGAVLLGIGGEASIETVVAQGAEPIGLPWTITECARSTIQSIAFKPAMDVLVETVQSLDPPARERARRNLLVGLAVDEYRDEFHRGDFLIRNLTGADRQTGSIGINALPRPGQTIQFQLRDAAAADDDLRRRLADFKANLNPRRAPLAAILCTCNGRGMALFSSQNHDARALEDAFGSLPVAGLFCNGEIGPVGGRTFVHGFTASIAFLTVRAAPA